MLITIFMVFLILALVLIIIGSFFDLSMTIIGSTILFLLGTVLMFSGLEYQAGEVVTFNYEYQNETLGLIGSITQNTTVVNEVYDGSYLGTDYSWTFGFIMCVAGVFGFIAALMRIREDRKEQEGEGQVEF